MSTVDPSFRAINESSITQPAYRIDISKAKSSTYNIGREYANVGYAKDTNIPELQRLGAKKHYVLGDGSCWARATWQCALSQVLDNQDSFDAFIAQISTPRAGYTIPENLAKETIHILHQLKEIPDKNLRIKYLNHQNVDDTLVFFMRHVAAEYMVHEKFGLSRANPNEIKTNKNLYGGPEIVAFMRYFKLEVHAISKNDSGQWRYRHTKTDGTTETVELNSNAQLLPIMHNCIYSASDIHYEFISFAQDSIMSLEMANNIQSDYEFAVKTQRKYDELYKIESKDEKFAEKLQLEFQNQVEQDEKDLQLAMELANKDIKPINETRASTTKDAISQVVKVQSDIDQLLVTAKNFTEFKKQHPIRAIFAKLFHHIYVTKSNNEVVLDFATRIKVRKFLKEHGVRIRMFDFATDKLQEYANTIAKSNEQNLENKNNLKSH